MFFLLENMSSSSTPIPPSMLTTLSFLLFISIITPPYPARILFDIANPSSTFEPRIQPSLTFLIQDVLIINTTQPSSTTNTITNNHLPFSRPLQTYPPIFKSIPTIPQTNNPTQTVRDTPFSSGFGISIPATSTLENELQFGHVTNIEQDMYVENGVYGPELVGKAKGIYVATSSDDGNTTHMMAMTASLIPNNGDDNNAKLLDSLKLFGVHRRDVLECHAAVIGGTGKFKDANGFATIRGVKRTSSFTNQGLSSSSNNDVDHQESSYQEDIKLLLYNVYLS